MSGWSIVENNDNVIPVNHVDVSFVVPAYQAEGTIATCLNSIIAIDQFNWELIVVNDGSTDDTARRIQQCCLGRNDCKIIDQENRGRSVARNVGIECATGDWLMFVDADDRLLSHAGKAIAARLSSPSSMIVFSATAPSKDDKGKSIYLEPAEYINAILRGPKSIDSNIERLERDFWFNAPYMRLIKKESIGLVRFVDGIRFGEDALFNIDYALHSNRRIELVYENMYNFNTEVGGTIRSFGNSDIDRVRELIELVKKRYASNLDERDVRRFIGTEAFRLLSRYVMFGALDEDDTLKIFEMLDEVKDREILDTAVPSTKTEQIILRLCRGKEEADAFGARLGLAQKLIKVLEVCKKMTRRA